MIHEVRSSIRSIVRRPFYPAVAVAILATGLAAGIAVFTYVNGFFQPFPGVATDRLVRVFAATADEPFRDVSYLDFQDLAASTRAFEALAATQPYYAASVRHETFTEVAFLEIVSGDYFAALGLAPRLGRGVRPPDDIAGADAVAVLSHGWWQRSFDGDADVVGQTVFLNSRPFTIVGVMPPDFVGTTSDFRPDVWIPFAPFKDRYVGWARRAENRDLPQVRLYGKLAPGVRHAVARAELATLAAGLDEAYPPERGPRRFDLTEATWIDPRARTDEWSLVRLMLVAAGGLLLLVCANVANVLLSVASGRQRELTMRAALGASPGRLVLQVLTESLVLSMLAGAVALVVAIPASARLGSYFARPSVWGANVAREAGIDWRVVLFALGASVLAGTLAGLLPALRASRTDLVDTLKHGADAGVTHVRRLGPLRLPGMHDLLVTAQVGLAVVLLVVAGLVLRTFGAVRQLEPGFATDPLVVTHISTSSTTLQPEERDTFFRDTARLLADEAWVRAATVADFPPLSPHATQELRIDGQSEPEELVYSLVIPGFFEALGIATQSGRTFDATDDGDAPDVAVVNASLARRFFTGGETVGRRLWWPGADGVEREFTIVGVVQDTKTRDLFAAPEPTAYFAYPQFEHPSGNALLVVADVDPRAAVPLLNGWLRRHEPHLAIINVVTYADVMRGYLYTQRMNAELFSVLAFLGLGLAAVGIFSVISLAVARRTREFGVRLSIGARRADIGRLVIGRALLPVGLGLGVGLIVAFATTGLVRGLLYGVEPADPLALGAGAAVLIVAGLLAAWLPARRATRVDPAVALRHE